MASPATIRDALASRLESISGLKVYPRWPRGGLNVPCAVIMTPSAEPEQVFGRGDLTRWDVSVHLFVSLAPDAEQAQRHLDPYLATSSTGGVFGAVAADRTLGGAVDTVFDRGYSDYAQQEELPEYLGATVNLELWST